MTTDQPNAEPLPPRQPSERVGDLGFLDRPDAPDRPGPAFLLVAVRAAPALRDDDLERIEYRVRHGGRDERACLTRSTPLPLEVMFSWGLIRLFDRVSAKNEYLTFGGHLHAADVDGATIAAFTSPVPLLRRGGPSQDRDWQADVLAAFVASLMATMDAHPQFEPLLAFADPVVRYAVCIADLVRRFLESTDLRAADPELWTLACREASLLERDHSEAWHSAIAILADTQDPALSVPR